MRRREDRRIIDRQRAARGRVADRDAGILAPRPQDNLRPVRDENGALRRARVPPHQDGQVRRVHHAAVGDGEDACASSQAHDADGVRLVHAVRHVETSFDPQGVTFRRPGTPQVEAKALRAIGDETPAPEHRQFVAAGGVVRSRVVIPSIAHFDRAVIQEDETAAVSDLDAVLHGLPDAQAQVPHGQLAFPIPDADAIPRNKRQDRIAVSPVIPDIQACGRQSSPR